MLRLGRAVDDEAASGALTSGAASSGHHHVDFAGRDGKKQTRGDDDLRRIPSLHRKRSRPHIRVVNLDLSDEETAALIRELADITCNDRYPFSPRIRTLTAILAKLRPEPRPPPADGHGIRRVFDAAARRATRRPPPPSVSPPSPPA